MTDIFYYYNGCIVFCKLISALRISFLLQIAALSVALFRALNLTTRYDICYDKTENIVLSLLITSAFEYNFLLSKLSRW